MMALGFNHAIHSTVYSAVGVQDMDVLGVKNGMIFLVCMHQCTHTDTCTAECVKINQICRVHPWLNCAAQCTANKISFRTWVRAKCMDN